ncbi:Pol polyprotein [Elysia marginata]|uniref:Pol polyprotein n=1 Tax=Elysia marginata TaxID=1093978 RepID=A0AAV4GPH0_9GAST|nr:Pol polyprotein [Elysia marginata]
MNDLGIIEKVTDPTDWCSPMVPVLKKNGEVRICTDFKNLNKHLKRERYRVPTADFLIHKLTGSTVFSKLDLASGFWQIPLDQDTAKLTTFITPCGRSYYKPLPFGISSAPEIFQRTMVEILRNESNTICYMDGILIYSKNRKEHEKHLRRYSQIEKECLGIVWACERFDKYLTGLAHFTAVTDHKPLLPIVNKKGIPEAPTRCK